jgi:anion-transporting  ArsA/GET3 family ATPase
MPNQSKLDSLPLPEQKLLFVLGKGGVGRSTLAAALAAQFASQGENALIVQWSVHDAISPQFGAPSKLSHQAQRLTDRVWTMSFDVDEAMREYFVGHLGLKLLHSLVIENRQVQRLLQAAPGVQELFFLGRLYWLVRLAEKERGWKFDRVIVDAPAMGHGVSLFKIAPAIAAMGIAGPLATECERVSELLYDQGTVGTVVVTTPEELPIEETIEFLPQITNELKRPPLFVMLNRSFVEDFPEAEVEAVIGALKSDEARSACRMVAADLRKREGFADQLAVALRGSNTPILRCLDAHLLYDRLTPERAQRVVLTQLSKSFAPRSSNGEHDNAGVVQP